MNFQPVSKVAVLFFKTAGFNRSPTPPFFIVAYSAMESGHSAA
jgi:hypothetical protein